MTDLGQGNQCGDYGYRTNLNRVYSQRGENIERRHGSYYVLLVRTEEKIEVERTNDYERPVKISVPGRCRIHITAEQAEDLARKLIAVREQIGITLVFP